MANIEAIRATANLVMEDFRWVVSASKTLCIHNDIAVLPVDRLAMK